MFPILAGLMLAGSPLGAQKVERLDSYEGVAIRMLQSNNAGNVHAVIDPAVNQVVGYIEGCPRAHNIFAHPDGLYYYCTNEEEHTLDVFDTVTLELVEQLALTNRPNKATYNKYNRKIYVGIASAPLCRRIRSRHPREAWKHPGADRDSQRLCEPGWELGGCRF